MYVKQRKRGKGESVKALKSKISDDTLCLDEEQVVKKLLISVTSVQNCQLI